ncbi:MAG: sigma-54 dependent transcriptional regulator, partial [Planctomycetes bacterium]|nr:sigma-54 dependent transcriptional regulator [Planctomycetota bacterium]
GKEIIARTIHEKSQRQRASFIAVNCGAIPESLQESTLFGHVRGAYTGADSRAMGLFEVADGGTVLLDEISETSPAFQVKLLRVLQCGEFFPVGSGQMRSCDVRIVSATNCDLTELVAEGRFRQDLYYRLNIVRLYLPPLRERREDIPLLTAHFLEVLGSENAKPGLRISPEASEILLAYRYPGNVRELKNIVHRATILCRDGMITPADLPAEVTSETPSEHEESPATSFHQAKAHAVECFEREYLTRSLREAGGIVSRAARNSGLSERNFHEKLKKYGIQGRCFRA